MKENRSIDPGHLRSLYLLALLSLLLSPGSRGLVPFSSSPFGFSSALTAPFQA